MGSDMSDMRPEWAVVQSENAAADRLHQRLHRAVEARYYRRVFRVLYRLEEGGGILHLYRRHRDVRAELLARQAQLQAGEPEAYENEAADIAEELSEYPETPPVSWTEARGAARGRVADWAILATWHCPLRGRQPRRAGARAGRGGQSVKAKPMTLEDLLADVATLLDTCRSWASPDERGAIHLGPLAAQGLLNALSEATRSNAHARALQTRALTPQPAGRTC